MSRRSAHGAVQPHLAALHQPPPRAGGQFGAAGSPLVIRSANVLYFAAPLFAAYRSWDYWVYREMAIKALRAFLPPPLLLPRGPGWVEMTLHTQASKADHPARKIVHLVAYHPRRCLRRPFRTSTGVSPPPGWAAPSAWTKLFPSGFHPAPGGQPLEFAVVDGYLEINLPPVCAHTVVVIERNSAYNEMVNWFHQYGGAYD